MNEIVRSIQAARNIDDLLPLLEMLREAVEQRIEKNSITAAEIQEYSSYITQVRLLLNELLKVNEQRTGWRSMAGRYYELEGKVKEIRNDLDLAARRFCGGQCREDEKERG